MDYQSELKIAIIAARGAGKLLIEKRNRTTIVKHQSGRYSFDITTSQDLRAHNIITRKIHQAFPQDIILSEESETIAAPHKNQRIWIVDPLDGTRRYYSGADFFSISIALYENGEVKLGVVYAPALNNLLIHSVRGKGVFENGHRISYQAQDILLKSSLIDVGFPHNRNRPLDEAFDLFRYLLRGHIRDMLRLGTAVLATCLLIKKQFHVYMGFDLKPWDVAPGILFVEELGGVITNFQGHKYDLFKKTNAKYSLNLAFCMSLNLHEQLIRTLSSYHDKKINP